MVDEGSRFPISYFLYLSYLWIMYFLYFIYQSPDNTTFDIRWIRVIIFPIPSINFDLCSVVPPPLVSTIHTCASHLQPHRPTLSPQCRTRNYSSLLPASVATPSPYGWDTDSLPASPPTSRPRHPWTSRCPTGITTASVVSCVGAGCAWFL